MSSEITMPKLSDTMEEGKILRWLKHPGDEIHHGDQIAEVETDKADMVLEAFDDGVLDEVTLKEGESAKVGAVIATLRKAGDAPKPRPKLVAAPAKATTSHSSAPSESSAAPAAPASKKESAIESQEDSDEEPNIPEQFSGEEEDHPNGLDSDENHPAMSVQPSSAAPTSMPRPPRRPTAEEESAQQRESLAREVADDSHKFRASPLARRAAEEGGIDLANVRGTGPEGRITKKDIDNFLREQQQFKFRRLVQPHEGAPGSREELSKMRKTIAHRMAQSKREIPHFYATVEVDMEEVVRLKQSLETTEVFDVDISYNDIIIKAVALTLARFPRMNASFVDDGIVIHPNINIGIAVAIEDGLILPVIRGCEKLSLPDIARKAHQLVTKASRGGFTSDELSGATFSISNMGMAGVEHFAAVIVPPQGAILAISAIKDRPVARDGHLAISKTMMTTVSCDHRIIDGIVGARFLQELKRFLENPASLLV
jgi:pyruvate dehydrogenase E2 component (dihydrolipoamide acetyltransferase)